jgi:hypothetical protein
MMPTNAKALEIDADYYNNMYSLGYTSEQADSFATIVLGCLRKNAIPAAVVGGGVGLALGGTVTIGTLAVPSWVVGIAVGGLVGEVKCANKPVRAMFNHEKEMLKNQIDRVLNFEFLTESQDQ